MIKKDKEEDEEEKGGRQPKISRDNTRMVIYLSED